MNGAQLEMFVPPVDTLGRTLFIRTSNAEDTAIVQGRTGVTPKVWGFCGSIDARPNDLGVYQDMPRFVQHQHRPYALFTFKTCLPSSDLSVLTEQKITDKTKSVWFPKKPRGLGDWAWIDSSGLEPQCPIFIISKGRPQCITARSLERMGLNYQIVVEPDELDDYRDVWGYRAVTGDFDTRTSSSIPVRNFVDEVADCPRYWLMDDNIEAFNVLTDNQKYVAVTPAIFRATEDFVGRFTNVGQAGFNYYSFAKKTENVPPFYLNTRIYSCTLMYKNLDNVSVDGKVWRGRYNEDTDLSIRILKAGYCTILMNSFLAGKITTQRVRGGNTDSVYVDGDDRFKFAESLRQQHPDVVQVVRRFGRWHHRVNYKGFTQKLQSKGKHPVFDYAMSLDPCARSTPQATCTNTPAKSAQKIQILGQGK